MAQVTRVATIDGSFEVTYDDGAFSRWSPEDLAAKLLIVVTPMELDLEASQLEEVAASALRQGMTVDDYIESAIVEKLLRDG